MFCASAAQLEAHTPDLDGPGTVDHVLVGEQPHQPPDQLLRRVGGGLGEHQHESAAAEVPHGTLDISFHRDDIGRNPIPKEFVPAHIPADVNGANVVIVDDVLFSGRTVKAALDELFDHGRPARVELAILVDRGGRRLPFAADYCGLTIEAGENEKVVVRLDPADPKKDTLTIRPA